MDRVFLIDSRFRKHDSWRRHPPTLIAFLLCCIWAASSYSRLVLLLRVLGAERLSESRRVGRQHNGGGGESLYVGVGEAETQRFPVPAKAKSGVR